MAEEVPRSPLRALLSAEPLPVIPQNLDDKNELYHYLERLHDYIRRLLARLTGDNIIQEIINNTNNTFIEEFVTIINEAQETTEITIPTAWQYNNTTHTFQHKTRTVNVITPGVESDWEDITDSDQPVNLTEVVSDLVYDPTTMQFVKTMTNDVYVLDYIAGDEEIVGGFASMCDLIEACNEINPPPDVDFPDCLAAPEDMPTSIMITCTDVAGNPDPPASCYSSIVGKSFVCTWDEVLFEYNTTDTHVYGPDEGGGICSGVQTGVTLVCGDAEPDGTPDWQLRWCAPNMSGGCNTTTADKLNTIDPRGTYVGTGFGGHDFTWEVS